MNPSTASRIAEILGHPVAAGDPSATATGGVCTDTRKLTDGAVFFALRGGNFDGDSFAPQALAAGARIAVVHRWAGTPPPGTAVIETDDTLLALQRLATWWRSQLDLRVVAITGSNGKTSTKDFTASVLSKAFRVSATRGNFNNHIGLPLTVLSATPSHTAAVWEMGMNHAGEIAPLCRIAGPEFGIITNIGTAHIEFLGSREAIAGEKGMLARALPAGGCLIVPASCEFAGYLRERTRAELVAVGNGRGIVRAEDLQSHANGTLFSLVIPNHKPVPVELPVPGRHMVTNALLAAAAGWKLGIPAEEIAAGLGDTVLTSGRLRRFDWHGVTVFDDTYNANPESMAAAIDTLAETPVDSNRNRIVVLGRMGELGEHAPAAHLRTGELAAARGLTVIAVGEGSEDIAAGANGAPHFSALEDAATWLRDVVKPGDAVLFKGSRTATVERVMHAAFPQD